MAGWTIGVDRARCLGSGMCVVYAPATFAHDDQAKAVVADPAGDPPDVVESAVDACPTGALQLITDGSRTGEPGGGPAGGLPGTDGSGPSRTDERGA